MRAARFQATSAEAMQVRQGSMTSRSGAILRSAVVAAAAYFAATGVERAFIHFVANSTGELLWISDVVLAAALGVVTYLWLRLSATLNTLSRLEREQIVLNTQLAVAADIQRRALPPIPAPEAGIEWAASLQPAGKIGGDFYDFVHAGDDVVLMLVGDISGKGIPAALLLALTRAVFRASARNTQDPAEVISRLSRALFDDTQGSPYATCMVVAFHLTARTLTYANAGHPPALIVCPSGHRRLEPIGPPAGMFPTWTFPSATIPLEPTMIGVIVTDGVTESLESAPNDLSTGEREAQPFDLIEDAVRRARQATAEAVCQKIMRLAATGTGPPGVDGWQDDRTVVVFRVNA